MSLIKKIEDGQSPRNQRIDRETLQWIKDNKPLFQLSEIDGLVFNSKRLNFYVNKFFPNQNWFLNKRNINSIHGERHMVRVMLYSLLVSVYFKFNQKFVYRLCVASAIHDLRRLNDNADCGHGERSSKWFMDNKIEVLKFFNLNMTKKDIEEIYYMIFFHEKNIETISDDPMYNQYKNSINIFKAIDALDRYRLPKLKWWIDDRYLEFKLTDSFKMFAYKLVVITEDLFLSLKDNKGCLEKALLKIYKHDIENKL